MRCVKHLALCLANEHAAPYADDIVKSSDTTSLIDKLSSPKALAILWFSGGLVDEVGKMDSNSMKQ